MKDTQSFVRTKLKGIVINFFFFKRSYPKVFCKKVVLERFAKFTGKHPCQNILCNKNAGLSLHFIEKETLTQVFSCEFCEIFKITFLPFYLFTHPVSAFVPFSQQNRVTSFVSTSFFIPMLSSSRSSLSITLKGIRVKTKTFSNI